MAAQKIEPFMLFITKRLKGKNLEPFRYYDYKDYSVDSFRNDY